MKDHQRDLERDARAVALRVATRDVRACGIKDWRDMKIREDDWVFMMDRLRDVTGAMYSLAGRRAAGVAYDTYSAAMVAPLPRLARFIMMTIFRAGRFSLLSILKEKVRRDGRATGTYIMALWEQQEDAPRGWGLCEADQEMPENWQPQMWSRAGTLTFALCAHFRADAGLTIEKGNEILGT